MFVTVSCFEIFCGFKNGFSGYELAKKSLKVETATFTASQVS